MEGFAEFTAVSVAMDFVSWAISITMYVLQSLGVYTIAKRRGILNPWMAWVPVANVWIIGSIADHYRQVTRGETKKRRVALLTLDLVMVAICVIFVILLIAMALNLGANGFSEFNGPSYDLSYGASEELESAIVGFALVFVLFWFVLFGVAVAYSIVMYICLYEIYDSCDPGNKVLYLLLSIFLGLSAVFLFVCRNKDQGMYPRQKPVPAAYPPYPYQAPQYQMPQYQAPQYQAPQYQAPQYQAPQYQPPQYQQPQYQPSQYQAPQYQAPQYQAPQYRMPEQSRPDEGSTEQ